ncbi:MAG: hypothetical protein ABJI41_01260, partial [Erythrobacter sp.]
MRRALALACAMALTQTAQADTSLGTMRAFIDGTEGVWHTITMPQGGRAVATASFEQSGQHADFYFQGHVEPRFISKGMLSVEVRYAGQFDQAADPISVEIIYMPNGLGGQFFTTRGSDPEPLFQIVDISVWGEAGEITAAFSGKLCAAWMNRPRDLTDCKTLSGQVSSR